MAMTAAGLGQVVSGLFKKDKAKQIAATNIRPEYAVNQNVKDNVNLAESRAGEGLTDAAKQTMLTNADRGLSSSIDAILKSGGDANNIGDLNDSYLSSISNMSLAEDESRFRNMNIYMRTKDALKDEEDKAWQINKYAPWADKAQQAANLAVEGNKDMWSGINTGLSAFAMNAQGNTNATAGVPMGGGNPNSAAPLTMNGFNAFRAKEQSWGASTMFSGNAPTINYTPKTLNALQGLGIKPINIGPALPENWQTSERPYSNPYMWNGIN